LGHHICDDKLIFFFFVADELIFAPPFLRKGGAFFCPIFSAIPQSGMADFECNFYRFGRVKDFRIFSFFKSLV